MRSEKPEFLRDPAIDFWKRQDCAQTDAGQKECGYTNDRIGHSANESFAPGRFMRRRKLNGNLRNELATWHNLILVA
jgi:hypothetical protein